MASFSSRKSLNARFSQESTTPKSPVTLKKSQKQMQLVQATGTSKSSEKSKGQRKRKNAKDVQKSQKHQHTEPSQPEKEVDGAVVSTKEKIKTSAGDIESTKERAQTPDSRSVTPDVCTLAETQVSGSNVSESMTGTCIVQKTRASGLEVVKNAKKEKVFVVDVTIPICPIVSSQVSKVEGEEKKSDIAQNIPTSPPIYERNSNESEERKLDTVRSMTTSTPIRRRSSYDMLSKRRSSSFSRESNQDDAEILSCSSGLSPCSTAASLSFDKSQLEELSDSDFQHRESADFSDLSIPMQDSIEFSDTENPDYHIPYNKQLKVVTSMEFGLGCQSKGKMHKMPVASRSEHSSVDHIALVQFMKRQGFMSYLHYFPPGMTLQYFRTLTEDDLKYFYHIENQRVRDLLLQAIIKSRDGDTDHESDNGPMSSPSSLASHSGFQKESDELPLGLPGSFHRLQRTLSEDNKQRRRESLPCSPPPLHIQSGTGSHLAHSIGALIEPTNLLRIRNTALGQSAPSLIAHAKDLNLSRRGSRHGRRSLVGPNASPVLPQRSSSPQNAVKTVSDKGSKWRGPRGDPGK